MFGLTPRALRYYEGRGLIEVGRTPHNQRHYDPVARRRLSCVVQLRRAGLSLEDIGDVLSRSEQDDLAIGLVVDLIEARRRTLNIQLASLDSVIDFVRQEAGVGQPRGLGMEAGCLRLSARSSRRLDYDRATSTFRKLRMSERATSYDYSRYEALQLSMAEGIMTVTLSNPGRKNALTPRMNEELTTIWDDLMLDNEVRVIVITGEGGDFCSGADLSRRAAQADQPAEHRPTNRVTRAARKHIYALLDCEKPVLAKVRGVAYGFGVNLALGADMVFAGEGARFCDSHVKAGMVAGDGGVLLWPLLIGMHRAKEYLMTGDPVHADVAERIGLINRCLPDDQLDAHVQNMAEKLRDLPPHAVNYTKASLNVAMRQMTGAAFEASLAYEVYSMTMDDCKEAARAFVDKRKGNFTGT